MDSLHADFIPNPLCDSKVLQNLLELRQGTTLESVWKRKFVALSGESFPLTASAC